MVFGSTGKDRIHRKFYEEKDIGYNKSEEKRVEKKIQEFNEFVATLPADIDFTDHNNFKALNYRAKQAINQFRNNRMIIKGYIEAGTPNEWFKVITALIKEVFNPQLERLSQIEDSYWRKRYNHGYLCDLGEVTEILKLVQERETVVEDMGKQTSIPPELVTSIFAGY